MAKMLSLHDFDAPAYDDLATVSLVADVPQYCDSANLHDEMQPFSMYIRDYPEIAIVPEMLATRESSCAITAGDLFYPVYDSTYKKIANVWREKGFAEAIRLAASTEPEQITKVVHWIATRLKWTLDLMERGIYQREALPISGVGSVADIVTTRDWGTSLVRCLSWHPHCARIAVATRDDRIRIYSQGIPGIPVLRHGAQKSICCISWRPHTGRELAAACHSGVLVWVVELGAASNSLSYATLLKSRNHTPVTSVAWHPEGDLLASCSLRDLNMIIWDVSKEEGVPLKRVRGGGLCFLHWSPCGSRLFAATCRNVFRIWNTGVATSWHADIWAVPSGRVAASCFGPKLMLLFTSTDEPATIFSLPLQENIFDVKKPSLDDVKMAVPIIDFTKVNFALNDVDCITVGGRIMSMEWDPSGSYLAVLFQDSPVIVLIKTKIGMLSKVVEVKPSCLIRGFPNEVPNCMNFYNKQDPSRGAICLTIAWSSGRIQHFPIVKDEAAVSMSTSAVTLPQLYQRRNNSHNLDYSSYCTY